MKNLLNKASEMDTNGTSFKTKMIASAGQLVRAFGQPHFGESPDGKRKAEWAFKINGSVITIYDYKSPHKDWRDNNDWHIGGKNLYEDIIGELQDMLREQDIARAITEK